MGSGSFWENETLERLQQELGDEFSPNELLRVLLACSGHNFLPREADLEVAGRNGIIPPGVPTGLLVPRNSSVSMYASGANELQKVWFKSRGLTSADDDSLVFFTN